MIETRFKQTEIGLIPEDWKVEYIETFCIVKRGVRVVKSQLQANGLFPVFQNTNIPLGFYNMYNVPENTPFVIIGGSAGQIGICHTKYWAADDCAFFECKDTILKQFLYFILLHNQKIILQNVRFGTVPRLDRSYLQKMEIKVPADISEQQCIATALSDIDALISALDKKIEKKKLIKQGAMQQLLTGKKRLQGFTEPWVEKRLGEIGYTYNGLSGKSKENFGIGKAKYITFLNVLMNEVIDVTDLEFVNVVDNEKQNQVKKGDLFFNTSSETPEEVGMCSTLIQNISNTYLNSFCFGFRPFNSTKINSMFFAYLFRSQIGRDLMSTLAQGSTRYNLSKESFLKSFISVPSLTEQTTIAEILSDMDKEISDLEVKKAKYEQIKQGMMQQLLTGKIRLI